MAKTDIHETFRAAANSCRAIARTVRTSVAFDTSGFPESFYDLAVYFSGEPGLESHALECLGASIHSTSIGSNATKEDLDQFSKSRFFSYQLVNDLIAKTNAVSEEHIDAAFQILHDILARVAFASRLSSVADPYSDPDHPIIVETGEVWGKVFDWAAAINPMLALTHADRLVERHSRLEDNLSSTDSHQMNKEIHRVAALAVWKSTQLRQSMEVGQPTTILASAPA